jgi:hypothetical protein
MKIFLSWSKDRSKAVAHALEAWLPEVIQVARPFMSERSIGAGTFHHTAVREAIADADYCVVCVTPENASEPWLNYEAGAIAERLNGKTCPYLFGEIDFATLASAPLSRLQGRQATEPGTRTLLDEICGLLPVELRPRNLEGAFKRCWPELEAKLKAIGPAPEAPRLAEKPDLQEEMMGLLRAIRDDQTRFAARQPKAESVTIEVSDGVVFPRTANLRPFVDQPSQDDFVIRHEAERRRRNAAILSMQRGNEVPPSALSSPTGPDKPY